MLWSIPREQRDSPGQGKQSVLDLARATPGSAGLDLCATSYTVLTPEMGPQALPTGVFGLLPTETVGLLLERSSWTMKGVQVFPGVIDSDYTGEIKIMVSAPAQMVTIQQGDRVAQLVLVPLVQKGKAMRTTTRGEGGFGSSDAYWIQAINNRRPKLTLYINRKEFQGILDTGADVSVLSDKHWPHNWPKTEALTSLHGIGQAQNPSQSADLLSWKDAEGHSGLFRPYIIPGLPVNLWGRDIMENMGVYLYSPSSVASRMLMDQGLLPSQGLGVQFQGQKGPVQVQWRDPADKSGLEYF